MATQFYQEFAGQSGQTQHADPGLCPAGQGAGTAATAGQTAPEVVFVFGQFKLIDAESYQRTYSRRSGHPLARGYYVVTWPNGRGARTFGEEAVFHGPYRGRWEAEASLERPRVAQPADIQVARDRAAAVARPPRLLVCQPA